MLLTVHNPSCGARTRDGDPCSNPVLNGATRCRMHGGSSPNVLAKFRDDLVALTPNALTFLRELLEPQARANNPMLALAATRIILDKCGLENLPIENSNDDGWVDYLSPEDAATMLAIVERGRTAMLDEHPFARDERDVIDVTPTNNLQTEGSSLVRYDSRATFDADHLPAPVTANPAPAPNPAPNPQPKEDDEWTEI